MVLAQENLAFAPIDVTVESACYATSHADDSQQCLAVTCSARDLRANRAGNMPIIVILIQDIGLADAVHISAGHEEG